MNDKETKKYTGIILAAIMLASVFAMAIPATAVDEAASVGVSDSVPVISAVTFGPTSVDVDTNYQLNFTVTDDNTLNDLTTIVVEVYYDSQTGNTIRKHYGFTWTEGAGSTDFVASPAGYWVANSVPTVVQEAGASFAYTLTFKLDKVAIPSADLHQWNIKITATDDGSNSDVDTAENFDVGRYSEIAVNVSTIPFGTLAPGAAIPAVARQVTMTVNTQTDIDVTGADLVNPSPPSGSDATLAMTEGLFNVVNATIPTVGSGLALASDLTTAAQAIYSGAAETACALETNVTGYSSSYALDLTFDGTNIPSPQADGTYSGTWTVLIDASAITAAKY